MGEPVPREGEVLGQGFSQNMQLQIAAKRSVLWCHLVNSNEELHGQRFHHLPNYFGPYFDDIDNYELILNAFLLTICNAVLNSTDKIELYLLSELVGTLLAFVLRISEIFRVLVALSLTTMSRWTTMVEKSNTLCSFFYVYS